MKFLDPQHPFFQPLWRRIVTVVAPAAWAVVEFYNESPGWAVIFLGAAGYAAWQLFYVFDPNAATTPLDQKPQPDRTAEVDRTDDIDKGGNG